jgi:hypothetical protein
MKLKKIKTKIIYQKLIRLNRKFMNNKLKVYPQDIFGHRAMKEIKSIIKSIKKIKKYSISLI